MKFSLFHTSKKQLFLWVNYVTFDVHVYWGGDLISVMVDHHNSTSPKTEITLLIDIF